MIDANAIRANIKFEFNYRFDFKAFDDFINDQFINKKAPYVYIGLEDDKHFEARHTSTGLVTFIKGHDNYYWTTSCQIPQRIVPCVEEYLRNAKFKITKKGVAGFDGYDVMVVSF